MPQQLFCTADDVQRQAKPAEAYTDAVTGPPAKSATNPSLAQVTTFIANVSAYVTRVLVSAGIPVPIVDTTALQILNEGVSICVGAACERASKGQNSKDTTTLGDRLEKACTEFRTDLIKNPNLIIPTAYPNMSLPWLTDAMNTDADAGAGIYDPDVFIDWNTVF